MNNNENKECRLLSIICNDEKDWCDTYCCKCEEISDCDHKQLLQIKAENEKLKETERAYNYIVKLANSRLDKIEKLTQKLEKATKTLDNIQHSKYPKPIFTNCAQTGFDIANYYQDIAQQVLKEIKGE